MTEIKTIMTPSGLAVVLKVQPHGTLVRFQSGQTGWLTTWQVEVLTRKAA